MTDRIETLLARLVELAEAAENRALARVPARELPHVGLAVPCPYCLVDAGQWCVNSDGRPVGGQLHPVRHDVALGHAEVAPVAPEDPPDLSWLRVFDRPES